MYNAAVTCQIQARSKCMLSLQWLEQRINVSFLQCPMRLFSVCCSIYLQLRCEVTTGSLHLHVHAETRLLCRDPPAGLLLCSSQTAPWLLQQLLHTSQPPARCAHVLAEHLFCRILTTLINVAAEPKSVLTGIDRQYIALHAPDESQASHSITILLPTQSCQYCMQSNCSHA